MPPLLMPRDTVLRHKPEDPLSYQLYDTYEDYLSPDIQKHLQTLNQSFPLKGLSAFISSGEITKGQWVLYTQTCFVGQVVNGGVEQFIENCPGLIKDAAQLLVTFGTAEFQNAYAMAVQNFMAVIHHHAGLNPDATGDDLTLFWSDLEQAWRDDDEDRFAVIEDACCASDRNEDPSNWVTHLEQRVLDWVLDNPQDFVSKA